MSEITNDIIHANTEPTWKMSELPDYNEDGTANPKGDAAYWRERAEAAEAKVSALQAALDVACHVHASDKVGFDFEVLGELAKLRAKVARLTAKLQSVKSEVDEILRAALSGDCDRYLSYDLRGKKYCKWGVVSKDIAAVFDVTETSDIDVSVTRF